MIQSNRFRLKKERRRGAAAVEMAMVLGLLILLVFGIIEMGRAIMVNQVITNAAREGRRAVIPGATNAQVEGRVDKYLADAGITGYTKTIEIDGTPGSLATAPTHAQVGVAVSVPYSAVSFGVLQLLSPDRTFVARVNMRKE